MENLMSRFIEELRRQRWDDHRYYHHSRINQSLHLLSATTFVICYALLPFDPAIAALPAWTVAMLSRQSGHFFFEPKGYDHINDATHEYKEEIKVGYNLFRKWVLMGVWAAMPVLLLFDPSFRGLFVPHENVMDYARNVGWLWLWVGIGGLAFRTIQLFFVRDVMTGLVWATKIVTDPFNDICLYRSAPLKLLRGELIDPRYYEFEPVEANAAA
jgi:hypothetical protein